MTKTGMALTAKAPEHVDEAQYLTIWRRGGINSLYLEIGEGAHIEQVFPNPAKPEHAPDAKPVAH